MTTLPESICNLQNLEGLSMEISGNPDWPDGGGLTSLPENIDTVLAAKLPAPLFDPTTKSEHDIPITKDEAIAQNLVTLDDYEWLSEKTIQIYNKMALIADSAGFILADLKILSRPKCLEDHLSLDGKSFLPPVQFCFTFVKYILYSSASIVNPRYSPSPTVFPSADR